MWKAAKSRPSEPLIVGTIRLRDPSLRSMSTAIPRLTGPPSIANGLPSRRSNTRVITGHSLAAWTIAQAIRWVKETFIPRSLRIPLRAFRLASRVSTEIVRNEVAVGTSRLSSIAWASIPAGPRSAFASPAAAGATAVAPFPLPSAAASTSPLVTFAPGPLPDTAPRSTPFSAATRRASGVALTSAPLAAGDSAAALGPHPPPREAWAIGAGSGASEALPTASLRFDRTRQARRSSLCPDSVARLHFRERGADRNLLVHLRDQFRDHTGLRRRNLGVDLVGRDLDHGVALVDEITLGDVPLEDDALGDRLTHFGHLDLHGGRLRHACFECMKERSAARQGRSP